MATHAASPPSVADAESYARSLLAGYVAELRHRGADLFGNETVKCAPDGGPDVQCLIKIPYRRLESCAVAEGSVFVKATPSGLQKAAGSGPLNLIRQICYIGRGGERVPSPPGETESATSREDLAACEREHTRHLEEEVQREAEAIKVGTERYLEVVKADREAKAAERSCP